MAQSDNRSMAQISDEPDDGGASTHSIRGEETRKALIEAGMELFGERGFTATSIRELSKRSGANMAAISYHFGSKRGLYRAVVDHIVDRIRARLEIEGDPSEEFLQGGLPEPDDARQRLHSLYSRFAAAFIEHDEPKAWARIVMREQMSPTEAFDIFYERLGRPMETVVSTLIAICAGLDPHGAEAKIRAHALAGQVLGFLVSRETILRFLGVSQFTAAQIDLIHAVLSAHLDASLSLEVYEDFPR